LYFDKEITSSGTILANNTVDTSRKTGNFTSVYTADTNGKIFEGPADDYGDTTYFFAGANPNNWVKFAGYWWRIIRINGDGSIRMIYNGTSNATTGTSTQISDGSTTTFAFNPSYNDNAYVGYMYTLNEVHGLGTSSPIKGTVDKWYQNNIAGNTEYTKHIDTNAGFCGDRQPTTDYPNMNNSGGTGTTETYYGSYIRVDSTAQYTYKCYDKTNDLYTVGESEQGNKKLTYPVGLITADEVAFAGGNNANNESYWLYTNQYYWTMSPSYFSGSYALIFRVNASGDLVRIHVYHSYGVRPVINLKASTPLSGTGSSFDPYIVVGAN